MHICKVLECCNEKVEVCDIWFLKDFKGFTSRKLFIGKCKICSDDVALQVMKNVDNGKTYYNLYTGIEAVKTIYREKKRKIIEIPNIKTADLYGWIYGVNVQIKNKKGDIVQLRQYSSDFSGKKVLDKKIFVN